MSIKIIIDCNNKYNNFNQEHIQLQKLFQMGTLKIDGWDTKVLGPPLISILSSVLICHYKQKNGEPVSYLLEISSTSLICN